MSAFGFLVRWGSIGLGGLLLIGGVQAALTYRPRDESAKPMTTAEALALAGTGKEHFVSLDATLDPDARVYESFVSVPHFVRTDPNRVYDVRRGKSAASASLVGVTVAIDDSLMDGRIECQLVRTGSGGESLQSLQVMSPVDGTAGMMWVLSPSLDTEAQADEWQHRGTYQGALSRFDDLINNAQGLGYQAQQIRDYAVENLNIEIPAGATIVLDGTGWHEGDVPQACYAAVAGTDGNVIVRVASAQAPVGPMTGMLDASPLSGWQGELPALIGSTTPGRAMLLDTTRTAASENAKDQMAMRVGLIGGVALLGLGASTTWLKHAMKRKRRTADPVGVSPRQAMALGIPMRGATMLHQTTPFQQQPMASAAYPAPSRRLATPVPNESPIAGSPRATGEDQALEAEMAKWTNTPSSAKGLGGHGGTQDRRAA